MLIRVREDPRFVRDGEDLVTAVDVSGVKDREDVVSVITAADLGDVSAVPDFFEWAPPVRMFPLCRDRVRYVGAPVAAVIAAETDPPEVVLRVSARDSRRPAIERFTKEFAPLVTSGPPGVTGYATGRPPVREVFAYWPALIAKDAIKSIVNSP